MSASARRSGRRSLGVVVVALVILGMARPALAQANVGRGDVFPDFSALDQDNALYRLSDHRGKVILLHICAMWCPPCQASGFAEADLSDALSALVGADNFELVDAVVQDSAGAPTNQLDVINWRRRTHTPAESLHANDDATSELYRMWQDIQLEFFPTYFVIRTDGVISAVEIGFGPDSNVLLASRVRRALLETPVGVAKYLTFQVESSALLGGIARSLSAPLELAIQALTDEHSSNDAAVFTAMQAFIHKVQVLSPAQVSDVTATEWIQLAERLLSQIAGG